MKSSLLWIVCLGAGLLLSCSEKKDKNDDKITQWFLYCQNHPSDCGNNTCSKMLDGTQLCSYQPSTLECTIAPITVEPIVKMECKADANFASRIFVKVNEINMGEFYLSDAKQKTITIPVQPGKNTVRLFYYKNTETMNALLMSVYSDPENPLIVLGKYNSAFRESFMPVSFQIISKTTIPGNTTTSVFLDAETKPRLRFTGIGDFLGYISVDIGIHRIRIETSDGIRNSTAEFSIQRIP